MSDILKVKDFVNKEKCKCGALAVYFYMPSYEGKKEEENYFCENCVPRGCSCEWNYVKEFGPPPSGRLWKWVTISPGGRYEAVKEGEVWVEIDEKGREYPCCEFDYDPEGYIIYTKEEIEEINRKIEEDLKKHQNL